MDAAFQGSLAMAYVRSRALARDSANGAVIESGDVLGYGIEGHNLPLQYGYAIAGVQAMTWADVNTVVQLSYIAPNLNYPPGYGGIDTFTDEQFALNALGVNYLSTDGQQGPGPKCFWQFPLTPGDVGYQPDMLSAQCSSFIYLPGQLDFSFDPDPYEYNGTVGTGSFAYRGRYKLSRYRRGFRANAELWASDGTNWGWAHYDAAQPDQCIGPLFLPRNLQKECDTECLPDKYREVPMPDLVYEDLPGGFVGMVRFEIWGMTFEKWRAATGL